MPLVLDVTSTVMCADSAPAKTAAPFPRVTLSGQPVVVLSSVYNVTGCPHPVGNTVVPCITISFTTGSTRVLAGGTPVLLQNSQGTSVPNSTPATIMPSQARVQAQ